MACLQISLSLSNIEISTCKITCQAITVEQYNHDYKFF